jgi:hypothetical protein
MAAPTIPKCRLPHPLPDGITTDILTRSISAPICGLALLCPEWGVCDCPRPDLQNIIRATRVDTYTLPLDPPTATEPCGTISTTFNHTECDHIFLPFMRDPRKVYNIPTTATNPNPNRWSPGDPRQAYADNTTATDQHDDDGEVNWLPRNLQRAMIQRWISTSAIVVSQPSAPRRLNPGWEKLDNRVITHNLLLLRDEDAVRLLPYEDDVDIDSSLVEPALDGCGGELPGRRKVLRAADWSEKEVLPFSAEQDDFLFQRIRHLVVRGVPSLVRVPVDDVVGPSWDDDAQTKKKRALLSMNLNVGRGAFLWVRWDKLTRLESLFLDLRGYSTDTMTVDDRDLARIAGMLHGMRLKLLVIAGLRSWGLWPGPDPTTMQDVEEGEGSQIPWLWMNKGFGGELNVFKTFRGAVRPGGKLVLVDTFRKEEWMVADEPMIVDEWTVTDEAMLADQAALWFGV